MLKFCNIENEYRLKRITFNHEIKSVFNILWNINLAKTKCVNDKALSIVNFILQYVEKNSKWTKQKRKNKSLFPYFVTAILFWFLLNLLFSFYWSFKISSETHKNKKNTEICFGIHIKSLLFDCERTK